MSATRIAIDLRRAARSGTPFEAVPEIKAPDNDPELGYLKAKYRQEFRQAFEATLESLTPREAAVLRLHYLEAMTAEAIATIYRAHVRTVWRWITQCRAKILAETRRLLRKRMAISDPELDSLMVLVQSRLDVSIARFLDKADH
jgi:RNA polymerase sigma-70 factor (ECF subfamily)